MHVAAGDALGDLAGEYLEVVIDRRRLLVPRLVQGQHRARTFQQPQQAGALRRCGVVDQRDRFGNACRRIFAAHLARQAHPVVQYQPEADAVGQHQATQQRQQDLAEQRAWKELRQQHAQRCFSTGTDST
jgi:hypothetical protein